MPELEHQPSQLPFYSFHVDRYARRDAAIADASKDKVLFDKSAQKVKQTQAELKAFSERMGNPIKLERTQVVGYNRSVAGKVTQSAKRQEVAAQTIKQSNLSNVVTQGKRNEKPLTPDEISAATQAVRKQGYTGKVYYSQDSNTAFHGSVSGKPFDYMVIGTDAYPGSFGDMTANERITLNGCAAHEVVGHYETWKKGTALKDEVLDEAQASIRAAKFGVDLTEAERADLMQDAMERLKNADIEFEQVASQMDIKER